MHLPPPHFIIDGVKGDRYRNPHGRDEEEKSDKEPSSYVWHCPNDRYCRQHEREADENPDNRDKEPDEYV